MHRSTPLISLLVASLLLMGRTLSLANHHVTDTHIPTETQSHIEDSYTMAQTESKWPQTLHHEIGIEFVLISAGEFIMGSTVDEMRQLVRNHHYELKREWIIDETPQHRVRISRPFYLSKYEITQGQWERVMGSNPSRFKGKNRPVERVSWHDTHEFIRRLNQQEPVAKYRLPTEAEWEYAARGSDGRWYPWGHSFDATRLNFCDRNCQHVWRDSTVSDGYSGTAPVGRYANGVSPFGVHDMVGNVWEWVGDRHGLYPAVSRTDPQGPESGEDRVLRGGSWDNNAGLCRVTARLHIAPHHRFDFLGFRLVRTAP